jgi:L-seryl-tRNA(Ser) seleniumtransferase
LLKVHASNFRISGFTASASLEELVELGHRTGIPVLHDLGSGCLLNTETYGLAHEPTPQESVAAGADLVFFSGDKLLGGPQAGIVVGKAEAVRRLASHPLARAVRLDKLTLAALAATLLHYLRGEPEAIPIWRMIAASRQELARRARKWAKAIGAGASVVEGLSTVGGGSLPGETLPTALVVLDCAGLPGGADGLTERLRRQEPPIVARIEGDRVALDPRTVLVREEPALLRSVAAALGTAAR